MTQHRACCCEPPAEECWYRLGDFNLCSNESPEIVYLPCSAFTFASGVVIRASNGNCYPEGLQVTTLPGGATVVSVSQVFDAWPGELDCNCVDCRWPVCPCSTQLATCQATYTITVSGIPPDWYTPSCTGGSVVVSGPPWTSGSGQTICGGSRTIGALLGCSNQDETNAYYTAVGPHWRVLLSIDGQQQTELSGGWYAPFTNGYCPPLTGWIGQFADQNGNGLGFGDIVLS